MPTGMTKPIAQSSKFVAPGCALALPLRRARPQVVQNTLNRILSEWISLFISEKFNQDGFSMDRCLHASSSCFNHPRQLEFVSETYWLGCLFVQDITVPYVSHSAVLGRQE